MRKLSSCVGGLVILCCVLASSAYTQGVKKHEKSKVSFPIGALEIEKIVYIEGGKKYEETLSSKWKGKGVTGKLVSKFFPKGKTAEILKLDENERLKLNLKKKKCEISAIVSEDDTTKTGWSEFKEAMQSWKHENPDHQASQESNFEIIESVFRVIEKGPVVYKDRNCTQFNLLAYTKWQKNGQTGTDSLDVWIVGIPLTEELRQAQSIDYDFHRRLAKMTTGMDVGEIKLDWSQWLEQLEVQGSDVTTDLNSANAAEELKKLDGIFSLNTKGAYYKRMETKNQVADSNSDDAEQDTDIRQPAKKTFKGFGKSLFKKKKEEPDELKPLLEFDMYQDLALVDVQSTQFESGWECKRK